MKTYGTYSGSTENQRRSATSAVEIPHEMLHPDLEPLGELLTLLTGSELFTWSHTFTIGTAGTVFLEYKLDPTKLTPHERDFLLSFAAKLTNWWAD